MNEKAKKNQSSSGIRLLAICEKGGNQGQLTCVILKQSSMILLFLNLDHLPIHCLMTHNVWASEQQVKVRYSDVSPIQMFIIQIPTVVSNSDNDLNTGLESY